MTGETKGKAIVNVRRAMGANQDLLEPAPLHFWPHHRPIPDGWAEVGGEGPSETGELRKLVHELALRVVELETRTAPAVELPSKEEPMHIVVHREYLKLFLLGNPNRPSWQRWPADRSLSGHWVDLGPEPKPA